MPLLQRRDALQPPQEELQQAEDAEDVQREDDVLFRVQLQGWPRGHGRAFQAGRNRRQAPSLRLQLQLKEVRVPLLGTQVQRNLDGTRKPATGHQGNPCGTGCAAGRGRGPKSVPRGAGDHKFCAAGHSRGVNFSDANSVGALRPRTFVCVSLEQVAEAMIFLDKPRRP